MEKITRISLRSAVIVVSPEKADDFLPVAFSCRPVFFIFRRAVVLDRILGRMSGWASRLPRRTDVARIFSGFSMVLKVFMAWDGFRSESKQ